MKTILLYGTLGKKFGKEHKLDVKDPAEAVRALCAVIKGFKKYMINDKQSGYKILVGSEDLYTTDYHTPTSDRDFIRIVPIIQGAGSNDNFNIVLGIIIIAIATYYSGGLATDSTAYFVWGVISQIGVMLVINGVANIIAESLVDDNESPENDPSYNFDGPVNTTRQGNAVPVGYGRLRIGSQVISAGLNTE